MGHTPAPPTRQRGITVQQAPCPALLPALWAGPDPASQTAPPPHRHRPIPSKYSSASPSLLIQAKVRLAPPLQDNSFSFIPSFEFSSFKWVIMLLSAVRFCHLLSANSSVSTNGAHRSPPSSGRAPLRARPLVQAAVAQKGPSHHEQQLHLQHVSPSASGHKVWLSQQQNYRQSRWETSILTSLQAQEDQILIWIRLFLFHSLRKTHPSLLVHLCVSRPLLPGGKRNESEWRGCHG